MKIEFGEKIGTMELIDEIINEWNGKFIFEGQLIEGSEVKTRVPITFFL